MKHIKEELWKPLIHPTHKLLNDRYEISNLGNVRSVPRLVERRPDPYDRQSSYWMQGKDITCQFMKNSNIRSGVRNLKAMIYHDNGERECTYTRIDEIMKSHWPESKYTEKDWVKLGHKKRKKTMLARGIPLNGTGNTDHLQKYWKEKRKQSIKKPKKVAIPVQVKYNWRLALTFVAGVVTSLLLMRY